MAGKKCFVIMPISTPETYLPRYRDDTEHFFPHVYKCLFEPAIKDAGFEAVPPKVDGAEVIHAEIIRNLETAALVMCDMSILNPNVFFELGIRTAMDKPVCLVRDDYTDTVPFDLGIVNAHKYDHRLEQWNSKDEVKALADHIEQSSAKADNALWRHFGVTTAPTRLREEVDATEAIDGLSKQVKQLQKDFRRMQHPSAARPGRSHPDYATYVVTEALRKFRVIPRAVYELEDEVVIETYDILDPRTKAGIRGRVPGEIVRKLRFVNRDQ